MDKKAVTYFVIRCVWHVIALIIWIIALNVAINSAQNGGWFMACVLCLIPITLPIVRFIARAFGAGWATGSNQYEIDWGSGRIYNRGWKVALITGIVAIIACVVLGIVILPIYWFYAAYVTTRLGIDTFRRQ